MEFKEAMKIKKRMCQGITCFECPLNEPSSDKECACGEYILEFPEEAEEILKEWAEEHSRKTILQDFLEKYPNTELNAFGLPLMCPNVLGYSKEHHNDCMTYADCFQCWNRPLEG